MNTVKVANEKYFVRFGYENLNKLIEKVMSKINEGYYPCGEIFSVPFGKDRTLYFATMKLSDGKAQ